MGSSESGNACWVELSTIVAPAQVRVPLPCARRPGCSAAWRCPWAPQVDNRRRARARNLLSGRMFHVEQPVAAWGLSRRGLPDVPRGTLRDPTDRRIGPPMLAEAPGGTHETACGGGGRNGRAVLRGASPSGGKSSLALMLAMFHVEHSEPPVGQCSTWNTPRSHRSADGAFRAERCSTWNN